MVTGQLDNAEQQAYPELRVQLDKLASNMNLARFFAYIIFKNGHVIGVSSTFGVLQLTAEIRPTSPIALVKLSKLLDRAAIEKPAGHIIRRCNECTFVFYASSKAGLNAQKLLLKLEQMSVDAMSLLCPLLKTIYPPSADLFITNNARLRERVLSTVQSPRPTLTTKERECLRYAAQGLTVARIAEMLHNSRHTISEHMQMIKHKLNANTISEALFYSLYLGIINQLDYVNDNAVYKSDVIE